MKLIQNSKFNFEEGFISRTILRDGSRSRYQIDEISERFQSVVDPLTPQNGPHLWK